MYKQDQNGVLEVQDEVQRFRVMVGGSRKESESKSKRWRVRLLFRGMNKAKRLSRIGFIQLLTEVLLLHILMVLSELGQKNCEKCDQNYGKMSKKKKKKKMLCTHPSHSHATCAWDWAETTQRKQLVLNIIQCTYIFLDFVLNLPEWFKNRLLINLKCHLGL